MQTGSMASQGPASTSSSARGDDNEAYAKSGNLKRARKTWAITDVTAPSRTPQVLFIPGRRKPDLKRSKYMKEPEKVEGQEEVSPNCLLMQGKECG